MEIPETPYTTWTRMQNYPKITRQEGAFSVVDKFSVADADIELYNIEDLDKIEFNNLKVISSNCDRSDNAGYWFVTLNYGRTTVDGFSTAVDGVTETSLEDSGQEIPVDARKTNGSLWFSNYKTKWNYILGAKKGTTVIPGFWDTATDTTIAEASAEEYKWFKDSSDVPEGWYVLKEKTKRIETVLSPCSVVVEITKYVNYNQAVAKRQTVGIEVTPSRTFGISGSWLVMASNVSPDGKKWVCTTRYQNAPEWDTDVYD